MIDPTPVANLLRIAFYAGGLLEELEACEAGRDSGVSYVELLGRMVADAAWRIRSGGYQRGYLDVEEQLSRPRGRLLLGESFAKGSLARMQMWCAHDDFSDDTPDNRVLRAVVRWLLADGRSLDAETTGRLEKLQFELRFVSTVRLELRLLGSLSGGIASRRYRVIRYVARLLVEQEEPDGEGHGDMGISLRQDRVLMRRVFERFIYRFAKRCRPDGTEVGRAPYRWSVQSADHALVPRLVPDVVLRSATASRVIECKYTDKVLSVGPHGSSPKLRSAHLQQLFSYLACEHRHRKTVTGLLVYPRVGAAVRVATKLAGHDVVVSTLDLGQPWAELTAALRGEILAGFAPGG